MSDDTITHTPAEKGFWYKLAIMSNASEPSHHIWNGYMRFLMEANGVGAEANKVKVIGPDGKDCNLPELTPYELEKVRAITGLLENIGPISFENCVFDNSTGFASFYFSTDVSFNNASFEGFTSFWYASFGDKADFRRARFQNLTMFIEPSFAGRADFSDASFAGRLCISKAKFADTADFSKVKFADRVDFKNASFANSADFNNARFLEKSYFSKAKFANSADFNNARFLEKSYFSKAKFAGRTDFNNTCFEKVANFSDASFADRAIFTGASFAGFAGFNNANFAGRAYFTKAEFKGDANFSASPDTPPHKGSVSFAGATFTQAPAFFERQLHEDTDWHDVKWPEPPSKERASDDVRRYERLSLMMSRLEKYDDMHTFFRLSMRAKEIRDGRYSIASLMSRLYGKLFDYGWGVECALGLWALNILVGFGFILGLMFINGQRQSIDVVKSLALSFSNAHSFIGLHSGAQANLYDAASDIPWFNVIWGAQTVVGLFLLFFFLLTIRNRFRMR